MLGLIRMVILFYVVIGTSLWAYDPWPDQVRFHVEDYHNPINDRYLSTVYGSCQLGAPRFRDMPVLVEDYRVVSEAHLQGELPIKLGLQRNHRGQLIQAPVMFVIPGAFNNLNHRQPRDLMAQFSRLGHHVVMFPNPWGTQYISHNPHHFTGSFKAEGQAIYQALRRVFKVLDEQGLIERGQTRVYGVSYGGFVAGMIAGLDAVHERPIIEREITIVSPPFHIGRTLLRLDDLIDETAGYIALGLPGLLRRFFQVCQEADRYSAKTDERRLKDAKGLATSQGFHAELATSLKALDRVKNLNSIPGRALNWLSPRYRHWYRTLNFEKYLRTYSPDVIEQAFSPEANLYYWIHLNQTHGKAQARVLVADDDFLNDYSWTIRERGAGDETLFLENGGHYGFRRLPWYRLFHNQSFFRGYDPD